MLCANISNSSSFSAFKNLAHNNKSLLFSFNSFGSFGSSITWNKGEELGMVYAYYDMNLDTKEIAQKMQLTEGEVTDIIRKNPGHQYVYIFLFLNNLPLLLSAL
mgnify:CR=1 FL=1